MPPLASTRTTHVKQFGSCQLTWYIPVVLQVPTKHKAHFDLGTLIHRELELWFLGQGEPARLLARAAVPVIEAWLRKTGCSRGQGRAEWNFKFQMLGLVYGGTSDLVVIGPDGQVWVLDYKTCSNLDAWALTDQQLANDTQLGVYAHRVLEDLAPHAPGAHVAHVQIQTVDEQGRTHDKPGFEPRVEIVEAWMPREKARAIWTKVEGIVVEMKRVAELPLEQVPGNLDHCGVFGGCEFKARCHVYAANQGRPRPSLIPTQEVPMTWDHARMAPPPPPQLPPPPAYQPGPAAAAAPVLWVLADTGPELGAGALPQPVRHADVILAPLQLQVAAEAGVPWYTLLDFGKGPAWVIAKLAAGPALTGTVLVDTMTPCGQAMLEYLRPRAQVVLRRSR